MAGKGKSGQKQPTYNRIANLKGKGLHTNPENINREGRPKKLINEINDMLKSEGFKPVTESQLVDVYMSLMNLPEWKINELKDDPGVPLMMRTTIERLTTSQGMEQADRVYDRAFGRVMMRQAIDTKVSVKPIPEASTTSREDLLKDVKAFLDPSDLAIMNQSSDEPTE